MVAIMTGLTVACVALVAFIGLMLVGAYNAVR